MWHKSDDSSMELWIAQKASPTLFFPPIHRIYAERAASTWYVIYEENKTNESNKNIVS